MTDLNATPASADPSKAVRPDVPVNEVPTGVTQQDRAVEAEAGTHAQPANEAPHPADLSVPYQDRARAVDAELGGYEGATDPATGNAVKRVVVSGSDNAPGTVVNRTLGPDVTTLPTQPPLEVSQPHDGSEDGQGPKAAPPA